MASNLGQTLMGGGGGGVMPSSLAQDIATGNFHDSRESFHDYIYSKLILGEDSEGSANNTPVFPPSGLPNYASSMGPPPPRSSTSFAIQNQNQNLGMSSSPSSLSSNNVQPSSQPAVNTSHATIPSTPQVSTLKPSNSKKNLNKFHHKNQLSTLAQINVPNHEGLMATVPKPKKNKSPKKKEKTNFCDVCGRGFAEKYTLNRHMLTHTHVKPYSCTKCNMAFSRSDGLAKHMNAGHRRIDAHHCDVCGGTFNSELSFEQHKREYGSTLPFVCNLCMLAFSQCCHLNYHMKSHSLKSDYGVEVTADSQNEPIDIDELVPDDFCQPKSKESPNKISGLNFAALGAGLNANIRIKNEIDDSYPYAKSGDNLPGSNNTEKHTDGVSPNQPLNSNSSENNAINTISEIDMKKYYDIKVPNPRFLEATTNRDNTVSQPTDLPLFRCHICGKGFTRKYHMQRHVRLHTRGPVPRAHLLDWTRRPYACGVCKMGFTRQHHLTRHMLIHTGERPHSCHICGKAFRRYTNLSLHVRTVHGSERPYKCPICGRGFPRVYSLQRHLNTHGKNNDQQLLMNAGLLPFPKNDAENQESKKGSPPSYVNLGVKDNGSHPVHMDNEMRSDALLSSGSEDEVIHHPTSAVVSRERQMEIDRINASIESTIGDVIKGAMAQNKPSKAKSKKSSSQQITPSSQAVSGVGNALQADRMMPLSLQQQQQQQINQQQQHHHQQQQQQMNQQQSHQQPQHSRHPSISQDSDQYAAQSSIMSNAISRVNQQSGGFNDMTMRSSTPYAQQQQQQQQQHQHHQQNNSDRSNTPFNLNQHQQQQQQQQPPNDGRSSAPYNLHHGAGGSGGGDKPGTPYTINPTTMSRENNKPGNTSYTLSSGQNVSDRSSTPFSHAQANNSIDRSSTPFMLNQPNNLDAFSSASARNQTQQIVVGLDRPESRGEPIVYSHPTNGFQLPMGTMDLSTARNRLDPNNLRQAQVADFSHNLTMSQAALNEAAAFAHVQATNNLPLFPSNAATLTYQHQLMGEALSRLDMELQVAHQGNSNNNGGQLPSSSHNSSRPY